MAVIAPLAKNAEQYAKREKHQTFKHHKLLDFALTILHLEM